MAEALITKSFAPGLAPLIRMAVDAAASGNDASEAAIQRYRVETGSSETINAGAYAYLSSCRLWMSTLKADADTGLISPLVCAVLWRLLLNFACSVGVEGVLEVGGPVLEVLFLATDPEYRQTGEAMRLVQELESSARDMGCIAAAVAAVPKQGVSFWQKCGYTVAIPLKSIEDSNSAEVDPKEPGLGEPLTPLGFFLRENMLLFTDTPLVVKMFHDAEIGHGID
jgi:GNAT superfamily N-acetyltransferase